MGKETKVLANAGNDPVAALAEHFERAEIARGGFRDRFTNPMSGKIQENEVSIPIGLLRAIVEYHKAGQS